MSSSKVPAAENTLRILQYLATRRGPVGAGAIAAALELPRSSVYHLLAVLERNGFVLHLVEEKLYGLGVSAFELSYAFERQEPLARLGRPLLASLVDRLGESAHLGVLQGQDVVYLVEERARYRPSLATDVGVRLPAHLTATGRALMAALPPAQVRALYAGPQTFPTRTGKNPITSYGALKEALGQVQRLGYALEQDEVTEDFSSLAVVARDHTGWPAAAITVTFMTHRVPEDRWAQILGAMHQSANELSRRLYGTGATTPDPGV
ncbi:IclR family transcriptional regulator [Kocuria oceani]|uniref:IclR family transcriptional regulator n=1 Tax=Kocuria oceani TaxID=988827 RepID=A0ABV9TFW0_9MICC|nr:IclR family transcriptional regulator [Kocuria oceani]